LPIADWPFESTRVSRWVHVKVFKSAIGSQKSAI